MPKANGPFSCPPILELAKERPGRNWVGWPGIKPVEHSVAQVPVATLNSLAGTYAVLTAGYNEKTEDFDVAREDGTLVITYNGQKVLTLLPESDRKFFDSDSGMPVEFPLED